MYKQLLCITCAKDPTYYKGRPMSGFNSARTRPPSGEASHNGLSKTTALQAVFEPATSTSDITWSKTVIIRYSRFGFKYRLFCCFSPLAVFTRPDPTLRGSSWITCDLRLARWWSVGRPIGRPVHCTLHSRLPQPARGQLVPFASYHVLAPFGFPLGLL